MYVPSKRYTACRMNYEREKTFIGFSIDNMHFNGAFMYHNGDRYFGDMMKNMRWGKGAFQTSNNELYAGTWVADRRHGIGSWNDSKLSMYLGEWYQDKKVGKGMHGNALGSKLAKFYGRFDGEECLGECIVVYSEGLRYEGQVKNWKRNGKGKIIWPDGQELRGSFIDDEVCGDALLVRPDGTEETIHADPLPTPKGSGFETMEQYFEN